MNAKEARMRIENHMIVHHMKESSHCHYITEALQVAINVLGCYEEIVEQRNIALEQLNELGISFGEKMVRCKDCKYRGDYNCPMYSEEYVEWDDDGYHELECVEHDRTHDEGFCDMGVRWE